MERVIERWNILNRPARRAGTGAALMPMSAPRLCSHSGCGRLDKHSHKSPYEERCEIGLHKEPLCRICKEVRGLVVAATTRDHIVPKAKGGSDDESNLQSLCRACNSAKGDRDNEEFRNSLEAAASRV